MTGSRRRVGILATHPIQYYAPWYRALARDVELDVFFSHRQTAEGQAAAGFGVAFEWDVPLLDGYRSRFLENLAAKPDVEQFWGCNTPEIAGIIRDARFDAFIVHGWSTRSYWQAIRACWRSGTPVLVRGDSTLLTRRPAWRRGAKWPFYRAFVPRFDGYLVVGTHAKAYLVHYGADPAKCFPSPHAVDNAYFRSRAASLRSERQAVRREFGLAEDAFVALFAGKLTDVKDPATFVAAVGSAAAARREIAGLVVGDGPLRASLEREAGRAGGTIRFAGFLNQSAIVRAYVAADVLVLPSRANETWGLVVNEAMACGLPAVVTENVGCGGDLVVPGQTGAIVPIGDARALSDVLVDLAARPDYRRQLAEGAAQRVEAFSVEAAAAGALRAVCEVQAASADRAGVERSSVSVGGAGR